MVTVQKFDIVEFDVANQGGKAAPGDDESGCFNSQTAAQDSFENS